MTLVGLALAPFAQAQALKGQTIGIAPALISVKATRGASQTYPILVFNDGNRAFLVQAHFQDFILNPDGKVVFLPRRGGGKRSWSAASWLKLSEREFGLGPGTEKQVTLFISPPRNALPGTYRALVSFTTPSSLSKRGDTKIGITATVSAVVLVRVRGKTAMRPHLALELPYVNLTSPNARVILANSGNVHFFANGYVRFVSRQSGELARYRLKRGSTGALVLPRARRTFTLSWAGAPYFGLYTAKTDVSITGKRKLHAERHFILIRWPVIVAVLLSVGLAFLTYYLPTRYRLVKRD